MQINKLFYLLLITYYLLPFPLFSQTTTLSSEITAIENRLANTGLPPADRKTALERIARLYELSGDPEKAADAWRRASQAVPGSTCLVSLFHNARCLAAMGEFDRAETALRPVLNAGSNRPLQNLSRFLAAQINALKTGNTAALSGLLSNADFTDLRPQVLFSIWRISGDASARTRLISEFPQSPEARIARDESGVQALPSALWLLSGLTVLETTPAAGNAPTMFQTGSFGREDNARAMADRLRTQGFTPVLSQRTTASGTTWIVGAAPGQDPSRTMQQLREKGIEFFPVY